MVDKKTGCNSKFYFINSNPNLPDHDWIPVSDMRITPSGYLIMNFNSNYLPIHLQAYLFNRY